MPRKPKKRAHGLGSVYQRGGSGWRIRWTENGRRRYASGYPDRDTAMKVLYKILADLAAGRAGLPRDPKAIPTLGKLADLWIDRRKGTHRSAGDDAGRWTLHLKPRLEHLRPDEVDPAMLRTIIEEKLAVGLSPSTVRLLMRLLSTFYSDLVEQGNASRNPVKALPRATRRLIRPAHDPRMTPFLQRQEDVQRVFLALPQPHATIFAIGALAGLRPGETLSLEWGDVDLERRQIVVQRQVRHGKVGPPKSGRPRFVPIIEPLAKVLGEWKLATGGTGQLFRPALPTRGGREGSPPRYVNLHTVHEALEKALKAAKLPPTLTLYQCTRYTMASLYVMGGGSLERLQEILGHSSILVTQKYAHLRPELFGPADLLTFTADLSRAGGDVIDLAARRARPGGAGWVQHGCRWD